MSKKMLTHAGQAWESIKGEHRYTFFVGKRIRRNLWKEPSYEPIKTCAYGSDQQIHPF